MSDTSDKTLLPPAPVHPLSAVLTMALDHLWDGSLPTLFQRLPADLGSFLLWHALTIVTIGGLTLALVVAIQRVLGRDLGAVAWIKASVLAVITGSPQYLGGDVIGGVLLAWAGMAGLDREWLQGWLRR